MKTSTKPVFIMASERSGTNLLRRRLTEHQGTYLGPSPTHLLKNLYFREPYFGSFAQDENFLKLLEFALKLCTVHFAPWKINWTAEALLAEFGDRPRNTVRLMDFMWHKYVTEQGQDRYICKDNFLYEFALDIASQIPGCLFIYLYRDPRDVVASQVKRFGNAMGVGRFARMWEYEQTRAIRMHQILALQGRSIAVNYEDMVGNETDTLRRALEFMEVTQREREGGFAETVDFATHEWRNLNGETITSNTQKYRGELSRRQIALVEMTCKRQMDYLGYKPDFSHKDGAGFRAKVLDSGLTIGDKIRARIRRKNPAAHVVRERSRILSSLKTNYRCDQ